jgi:hypothetical protein
MPRQQRPPYVVKMQGRSDGPRNGPQAPRAVSSQVLRAGRWFMINSLIDSCRQLLFRSKLSFEQARPYQPSRELANREYTLHSKALLGC